MKVAALLLLFQSNISQSCTLALWKLETYMPHFMPALASSQISYNNNTKLCKTRTEN